MLFRSGEETLTATEGMYTIANVQSDTTITVAFDIIKHTLTMTAGANGSVAESEAEVDCGTDYTVTFVPNSGYKLGAVTLDGSNPFQILSIKLESLEFGNLLQ